MAGKFIDLNIPVFDSVEVCSYCGKETIYASDKEDYWDNLKYTTKCPECGKLMMMCDACLHAEDNPTMKCDWSPETNCFRNPYLKRD